MNESIKIEMTTTTLVESHLRVGLSTEIPIDSDAIWHDLCDHIFIISAILESDADSRLKRLAHIAFQGPFSEGLLLLVQNQHMKHHLEGREAIEKGLVDIFELIFSGGCGDFEQRIQSIKEIKNLPIDEDFDYASEVYRISPFISQKISNSLEGLGKLIKEILINECTGEFALSEPLTLLQLLRRYESPIMRDEHPIKDIRAIYEFLTERISKVSLRELKEKCFLNESILPQSELTWRPKVEEA